jgi:hypothetical protein
MFRSTRDGILETFLIGVITPSLLSGLQGPTCLTLLEVRSGARYNEE